jgi:hypothetical protein
VGTEAAIVAAPNAKEIAMAKFRKQTTRKPRAAMARPAERKSGTHADNKQVKLIEMLKRAQGATIDEIAAAFDRQKHTARGAIAGALKKKLGLDVTSEKVEGPGSAIETAPRLKPLPH